MRGIRLMIMKRKLPQAEELKEKFPLKDVLKQKREECLREVKAVLEGSVQKKIVCIGPCSADNQAAVLDYMHRLARLAERVSERLLVIPRVYTSKPRTNGTGYKGMLHRPDAGRQEDNISDGILAMRRLHLSVIQETGFFCADEMLYPEAFYYISDLLAYAAVGARSVENQQHRLSASGLDMPVGMKNPVSGDVEAMLNALQAAQHAQSLLHHGWECSAKGNPYAHGILRGYLNSSGEPRPNYHYEMLCDIHDRYTERNLMNPGVLIDCNHSNSRKRSDEQVRIAKEVFYNCRHNPGLHRFVKGLMIESYLEDGAQMAGEGIYGKSITDPCLGWEKTERLMLELAEMVQF